jgi:hypothetical protein
MTELMNKLTSEAGLSPEQAAKTITVIKQFVTEKFPMLAGAVDNVLGSVDTTGKADDPLTNSKDILSGL